MYLLAYEQMERPLEQNNRSKSRLRCIQRCRIMIQENVAEKVGFLNRWWWDHSHSETDKIDPYLISYNRINSEWIRDLNF